MAIGKRVKLKAYGKVPRTAKPPAAAKSVAASRRPRLRDRASVREIFRRFAAALPDPRGELTYRNPFTLLVAVVLSAQATDAGVNKATAQALRRRRHTAKNAGAR